MRSDFVPTIDLKVRFSNRDPSEYGTRTYLLSFLIPPDGQRLRTTSLSDRGAVNPPGWMRVD
jgi:hypothetical protein